MLRRITVLCLLLIGCHEDSNMSVIELRPNSDIAVDSWGVVPPITYFGAIKDEPDNDSTYCWYTGSFTGEAYFEVGFDDVPSNLVEATHLTLRVRREVWPDAYLFVPEIPFVYKYVLKHGSTIVFEQEITVPFNYLTGGYSYFSYDEFEIDVLLNKLEMDALYLRSEVVSPIGGPGSQDFFISEVRLLCDFTIDEFTNKLCVLGEFQTQFTIRGTIPECN